MNIYGRKKGEKEGKQWGEKRPSRPCMPLAAQRIHRRSVCLEMMMEVRTLLNQTPLVLLLCGPWSSLYSGAHPGFQAICPSCRLCSWLPHSAFYASTLQAPSWAQQPFLYSTVLSPVFKASLQSCFIHSFHIYSFMHSC